MGGRNGYKKRLLLLCAVCILGMAGCAVKKTNTEKIKDLEFTVIEEAEIPQELMEQIEKGKGQMMKLTYGDKGYLYIAAGYGEQPTSGYSVRVEECYETANAIYLKTSLIGPSKQEKTANVKTYPYVVIKMEFNEKNVVFE